MTIAELPLHTLRESLDAANVLDWKGLDTDALLKMSEEEVEALGVFLGADHSASRFAIGDWLNFVEKRWSERYSQMQHLTGLSYSTLRSYASVAGAIARVRRRTPEISWSHHEAVATLTARQQRAILDLVQREGWTVEQTREERKKYDASGDEDADSVEAAERKLPVREAARQVWIASSKHGETYHVPEESMMILARSLGEPV
jgi:hypothetical protein